MTHEETHDHMAITITTPATGNRAIDRPVTELAEAVLVELIEGHVEPAALLDWADQMSQAVGDMVTSYEDHEWHAGNTPDVHVRADAPQDEATSPAYYVFPGGHEVRHISSHLTSNGGQALQYVARATRMDGTNKESGIQGRLRDLRKALVFIGFEIERLERTSGEHQ